MAAVIAGMWIVAAVLPVRAADVDPVRIGVVQVLSGPQSKYGSNVDRGIELAADQLNQAGGINGRPIRLFTEDSAGNKDEAINAVRRVIGLDKVVLVIGPTLSTEMFAATPVANQRSIPSLALSATAPGIPAIGRYVFRMALPEDKLIPASVRRVKQEFHVARGAVLYANDDSNMKSASEIFKREALKNGIDIVASEAFGSKDVDFSAQLTKLAGLGVDVVMVSAYPDAAASILTQARRLGLAKVPFVGGNGFNSPKLLELAGSAADGTIVSGPWSVDKDDAVNQAFVATYKARFGRLPDQFGAQGYDGMMLVAKALAAARSLDPEAIRDSLQEVEYSGVLGPFAFDADREPARSDSAVTFQVVNNAFRIMR